MQKRLLVIVSHPIQYHIPIWQELAKSKKFELHVCFCSKQGLEQYVDTDFGIPIKWDIPLTSGYYNRFYRNIKLSFLGSLGKYFNPTLLVRILFGKYDAVYLHGFAHLTHILVIIFAKIRGKKVILRNIAYRFGSVSSLKKRIFSLFFKFPNYFLYIGKNNKDYYEFYGVRSDKLYYAPHIVNNDFFQQKKNDLANYKFKIRNSFGIAANDRVLLFCGKLFKKKQPDMLLRAFRKARLKDNWCLLMVGEGVMKNDLIKQADSRVKFVGFMNQSEISRAYIISEVIVLPSQFGETWGLVINEAFNFGCAAIVSDRVGCAPDLVQGKAGEVFGYLNEDQLVDKLEKLLNDNKLLLRYQQNAEEIIKDYTSEKIRTQVEYLLSI